MKKNILVVFVILLFCSCGSNKEPNYTATQVSTLLQPLTYAKHFTIEKTTEYTVLTVTNNGAPSQVYVLYKRGTHKPVVNKANAVYVQVPIRTTASLSSLYVGFLDRLQLADNIVAVDNIDYVSNKIVRDRFNKGEIKELAKSGELNDELAMGLHPDIIFTYGSGNDESSAHKKLKQATIPIVYCLDNKETSPLGRAEWLKFIACFYELDSKADSLFRETEKRYTQLRDSASLTRELPSVFTEVKLNDAWYVPGGRSFMASLIKDAHAHYCWANDSSEVSLPLSFEQVYKTTVNAEYWINLGFCSSKKDLLKLDQRYKNFKAYETGNVYNYNAKLTPAGGNEFWETGLIMPDLILKDMIKIFHPTLYNNNAFTYYRKLNE